MRRDGRITRRALVSGAACAAAGCALGAAPPLERIYRAGAFADADPPPLVVIPGAFGSVLRDARSGRDLWPGSSARLLVSDYRALALAFDEETLEPLPGAIAPSGVLSDRLGQDFYGALLRTLERSGGYRRARAGEPAAAGRRYYVFDYDWRLDNTLAAAGLHALIERIRADHGDAALRVDVLAHSNGGLLARWYARFGAARLGDDREPAADARGARSIRRLLLVGTPNLGTIQPALAFVRGEEMGLRNVPPDVVASCPGAPQLLPAAGVPWLADVEGRSVRRDVFDVETWRELDWCVFDPEVRARAIAAHGGGAPGRRRLAGLERFFARHLARARRFTELLSRPAPAGDARAFLFGGDCALTLARIVVERSADRFFARERPDAIAAPRDGVDYADVLFEPGDLVVTRDSLLGRSARARGALAVAHAVFLCEEHRDLTGNPTFQDNLLHTLLAETP